MPRPIQATVSCAALRHNLSRVRACAPHARIWAVVKANAYGHGLPAAVSGLADADGMALVEFEQAARLRALGWDRPLMMIEGAFEPADLEAAARLRLALVVHSVEQLAMLEAWRGAARFAVLLKFNSGMNRLGLGAAAFRDALARLRRCPAVASIVLMTHFADADVPGGADEALARFEDACGEAPEPRSMANSAAVIDLPRAHGAWVRPGIMLYGASPFEGRSAASLGLRPAMTLQARLIAVQTLSAGDRVGYGSTFTAPRPMRIGVAACGYADGYPRHAPTGTPVAVDGVRTRTVGRVAMDMLMVDLDPVPGAAVGSTVQLWGESVPIDAVAAAAGTIGYELMCALTARVPLQVEA